MTATKKEQLLLLLNELNTKPYKINDILTDIINWDNEDKYNFIEFIHSIDFIEERLKSLPMEEQAELFYDNVTSSDIRHNVYYYWNDRDYTPALEAIEDITEDIKEYTEIE